MAANVRRNISDANFVVMRMRQPIVRERLDILENIVVIRDAFENLLARDVDVVQ